MSALRIAGLACALREPGIEVHGVQRSAGFSARARIDVYRNNVAVTRDAALAELFPVVRQLVGDAFFVAMGHHYADACPPRTPVLLHWGADFHLFLRSYQPAADVPYLADVAALEYARADAYHAADGAPMDAARYTCWLDDPTRLGSAITAMHPAMRVLRSASPVHSLWEAHGTAAEAVDLGGIDLKQGEDVLVARPGTVVLTVRLPPGAAVFLLALKAGRCLQDAYVSAQLEAGFDAAGAFALLLRHGLATQLRLPTGDIA